MIPAKVIHIREIRRRSARAKKKKVQARRGPTVMQNLWSWLTSRTTKGTVLLAGVLAGLVAGAMISSVLSVPRGQVPVLPGEPAAIESPADAIDPLP